MTTDSTACLLPPDEGWFLCHLAAMSQGPGEAAGSVKHMELPPLSLLAGYWGNPSVGAVSAHWSAISVSLACFEAFYC